MLRLFCVLCFIMVGCSSPEPDLKNYLALGDSYTIGESVAVSECWPNQLVDRLNDDRTILQSPPRIIAQTGWTTDELLTALEAENIELKYDFVSLMIGVNNQYRGRSIETFREDFLLLIQKAMGYCKVFEAGVFVLSIPDWGVTPFEPELIAVDGLHPSGSMYALWVAKVLPFFNNSNNE